MSRSRKSTLNMALIRKWHNFQKTLLLTAFLLGGVGVGVEGSGHGEEKSALNNNKPVASYLADHLDRLEFTEFCEVSLIERQVDLDVLDDVKGNLIWRRNWRHWQNFDA